MENLEKIIISEKWQYLIHYYWIWRNLFNIEKNIKLFTIKNILDLFYDNLPKKSKLKEFIDNHFMEWKYKFLYDHIDFEIELLNNCKKNVKKK